MRYLLSALFVLLTAFMSTATLAAADTNKSQAPIVIGAIYNLTGAQSALDVPAAQGAQLAVLCHSHSSGNLLNTTLNYGSSCLRGNEEFEEKK